MPTTLPNDLGVLTALLKVLMQTFKLGSALVIPDALQLLVLLTSLEILLMGIWYLYSRQLDLGQLVAKVVGINVLAWIVTSWPALITMIVDSFIYWGLRAGGDTLSQTAFTDPSNIADYGMNVAVVVNQHLAGPEYQSWGAVYNLPEILMSGWLAIAIAVLYFVLACWIFVILLEFYATTAFSVVLVPFGALRHTAFLAEKTFAAVCASGIQIMGLAFITSVSLPVMVAMQGGMHPTLKALWRQLLGAIALNLLAWRVHKMASAVTSGHPQLTINDVGQIVQTTVATMSHATSSAVNMRNSINHITHEAAQAASNLLHRRRP